MADPCLNEKEFVRINERLKVIETDVSDLKQDRAETKVYVRLILEKIDNIKERLDSMSKTDADSISKTLTKTVETLMEIKAQEQAEVTNKKTWQPIVMELIKLLATCLAIIGGVMAGTKILN
jgi:ribulose 1,5-bisphosphate carboxylase large subunit-like protein